MDPQQQEQPDTPLPSEPRAFEPPKRKKWVWVLIVTLILVGIGVTIIWAGRDVEAPSTTQNDSLRASRSTETPELTTEVILSNRDRIWDIAFLPSGDALFTERKGVLSLLKDGQAQTVATIADVKAGGEGGLLGLAVDPEFATNGFIYTCYNTASDIRVVRWVFNDNETLGTRTDIITGLPRNSSGRHSGCRLAFGPDKYLWVGTGDTAQDLTPQSPQDPKSLGGKILRVTRDGKGAPGNMGGTFDSRIYSYGHRNVQGLAFFDKTTNGVVGINAEHGTQMDDEVNPLVRGNFGWAPPDGPYDESVPMTDKDRFPDAVEAIWSSGDPTQAPSGAAVLSGDQWKAWDGAVVLAMLKEEHLKILLLNDKLKLTKEERRFVGEFGRLRATVQGPDGSLYLTTDNGQGSDAIIRVTAKP